MGGVFRKPATILKTPFDGQEMAKQYAEFKKDPEGTRKERLKTAPGTIYHASLKKKKTTNKAMLSSTDDSKTKKKSLLGG
tara:strand:+ start:454 stop:693 length:240 start_codon:yes stop_codon:yes gene_type:complete